MQLFSQVLHIVPIRCYSWCQHAVSKAELAWKQ